MNTPHINPSAPSFLHTHSQPHRLSQFIGNTLVAAAIVGLFGTAFAQIVDESAANGVWKMLLMTGSGWVLFMLAAAMLMPKNDSSYLHGLSYIIANGALALVPASFAIFFIPHPLTAFVIAVASVAVAFTWMFRMHLLLLKRLELHKAWLAVWTLSLLGTATTWFLLICETDFSCILR